MESPNAYSTYHQMSASSSLTGGFFPVDVLAFGFPAARVRINNACSDRVFYGFGSGGASTASDFVAGCQAVVIDGAQFGGLQLLSTTSSSTARPLVGVSAWASA